MAQPICYIHINRTGGSSITAALKLKFEHKTAVEKRQELSADLWGESFKFTFVRNPWDKVVSHYFYRVKTNQTGMADGHVSFLDWVRLAYGEKNPTYHNTPRMFMPQSDWICDDDGVSLVDFVGRFESLQSDFFDLQNRLQATGLTTSMVQLPHINRSTHRPYQSYYDDETRKIVECHFARDLERFHYLWDPR